ncbi:hypothetical protein LPW11_18670 [Geomonas sp. RF6]|uniref:hypothetical protein n=1 Tax=Geomonas sp. RF6 TaxID=2897342 RepID=UPI001E310D6C|nr:hypothetical protein [Geomonas sp. RF6]UFS69898.1 hypothetical protein LPW11_18670 [Geomonas sp. RF6]
MGSGPTAVEIISHLNSSWQKVRGYQTETEVAEYRNGKLQITKSFLYSFRKPRDFRIDMHHPHRGTSLICCDAEGKILVRPGGIGAVFKKRLSPDNRLLADPSGQRIDQTDLGLLIRNIGHSLTDQRRGDMKVTDEGGRLVVESVASDHFLPGVLTRYRFVIEKGTWLPAQVVELTPEGVLKRVVTFGTVNLLSDFPPGFFISDREDRGGGGR